jgi:hypothetical protein
VFVTWDSWRRLLCRAERYGSIEAAYIFTAKKPRGYGRARRAWRRDPTLRCLLTDRFEVAGTVFEPWEIEELHDVE